MRSEQLRREEKEEAEKLRLHEEKRRREEKEEAERRRREEKEEAEKLRLLEEKRRREVEERQTNNRTAGRPTPEEIRRRGLCFLWVSPDHRANMWVKDKQTIDYNKEFGLSTDASDKAVGCCLFQVQEDGTERPICFASSKLDDTQARWSTVEREAYAVIFALKRFRNWIFMSRTTLYSDHNPLTFLTASTPTSAKLARWALALQDFDISFEYRPGILEYSR